MQDSGNQERNLAGNVQLVFAVIVLVVLAYCFSPSARAAMQASFEIIALLVGFAAAGAAIWLILRRKERRAVAQEEFLPRARVLNFPPQAGQEAGPNGTVPGAEATTQALVERLRALDWYQFEKVTAAVYGSLGYLVSRRGGVKGDEGIDLVVEKAGQVTAVRCKYWNTSKTGVRDILEFLGALTHAKIEGGIFITLQGYTPEAKRVASEHMIDILGDVGLARLLEKTEARLDPFVIAAVNDPRKYCPKCEAEMVLRTAAKDENFGKQFWGCSNFPDCLETVNVAA